jgi:hypothetical protein
MVEVLHISLTADARDLFTEYDISAIKKIRETALKDTADRQTGLRQFIGGHYRPLLSTPAILRQIQEIFEETKASLHKVNSFGQEFASITSAAPPATPPALSTPATLYLRSLQSLKAREFLNSLNFALESLSSFSTFSMNNDAVQVSLKSSIELLPLRIFRGIKDFLTIPSDGLTSESLLDAYSASKRLLEKFPSLPTTAVTPDVFLETSLVARVSTVVETSPNISGLCTAFLAIIEAIVSFLAGLPPPKTTGILHMVIFTATNAFQTNVDRFSQLTLRELFRVANSTSEQLRTRTAMPRFVSALRDLDLSINLWGEAFQNIFSALAGRTIENSCKELNLPGKVELILNDSKVENFNAAAFAVASSETLKKRTLGICPQITEIRSSVDDLILHISAHLPSQLTQNATIEMLKRPLTREVEVVCSRLKNAVPRSPLSVCLIAGSLSSDSVGSLLPDIDSRLISPIQDLAALEWAKKTANQTKRELELIPRTGAALSFLIGLENAILKAGGPFAHHPLSVHLRNESFKVVLAHFDVVLRGIDVKSGGIERRKQNEAKVEALFRDFSLISGVLSTTGSPETRTLFMSKMNPIELEGRISAIGTEVDEAWYASRELIKLISGGKQFKERKSGIVLDVDRHLDLLFRRV